MDYHRKSRRFSSIKNVHIEQNKVEECLPVEQNKVEECLPVQSEQKVEECLLEQLEQNVVEKIPCFPVQGTRNHPRSSSSCPHQFVSELTVQLKAKETRVITVPRHRLFVLVKGRPIPHEIYNAIFNTVETNLETTEDLKNSLNKYTISSVTNLSINIKWTFW
ncbi:uncharacterized protein LOC131940865 [Physella acuta]|uniref:uncharacterized protein LOC131940865 n=1 Tax=Physella acuta TaxID=109671 RepID=UPI0027DC9B27|nr:uncharacterized protein LOC131940865 [Physella acuta]